ncbi:Serpentine Receptor, class J [Caenorhabditis elegans]|uniref:Serpentine Receptor, class J n=1 Tax=Caenorhabditis elegans TaxID=6239 RepID=O17809_CAEEL|nr:Serpentine Receptor, class J [Caenorhabditis elegans]CAB05480.1 Serpentine Receptor, class J [Caenorhabditis elegans]|eukprot:NP_507046.1 Serpentine Receptor, class J [Caenorhabditis elegans]
MYIHWTHYYLPKVFGVLSFILNPFFIWLILNENITALGSYRYLLVTFASFDIIYTLVELAVPMSIFGTGAAFAVFVSGGPFYGTGKLGQFALSVRCGFISLSYGILVIHFVYRYSVFTQISHQKLGFWALLGLFIFLISHGIVWSSVCELLLYGDQKVADYIYKQFMKDYHVDSHGLFFLMGLFYDGSSEIVRRSWGGILILTGVSFYAAPLYFILAWKIVRKLANDNPGVSVITQKLNRHLFKALVVQTLIPICICFFPCMVAWYGPAFGVNFGNWSRYLGAVAFSAFPDLDPLAIILLLPYYRNKLFGIAKKPITFLHSGTSTVRPNVVRQPI